jgi:hypothetical protein
MIKRFSRSSFVRILQITMVVTVSFDRILLKLVTGWAHGVTEKFPEKYDLYARQTSENL